MPAGAGKRRVDGNLDEGGGIQISADGGDSGGPSAGFEGMGEASDALDSMDAAGTDSDSWLTSSGSYHSDPVEEAGSDGVACGESSGEASSDVVDSVHSAQGQCDGSRKRRGGGRPADVQVDEIAFYARCDDDPVPTNRQLQDEFGISYRRVQYLKKKLKCGQKKSETMAQDAERVLNITYDSLHVRWVCEDTHPVLHELTVPSGVQALAQECCFLSSADLSRQMPTDEGTVSASPRLGHTLIQAPPPFHINGVSASNLASVHFPSPATLTLLPFLRRPLPPDADR